MISTFAEFSYGVLHWSPRDFWAATPWDVFRAMAGWRRVNGLDKPKKGQLTPEKIKQLKALAEMHREMERKRG